jgi:DeoR family L-fucose operon activator
MAATSTLADFQLKSLEIDLFIFSCEGIDSHGALWDSNAFNADFKSLLLKRASQSLLLIDKSKFNRSGRPISSG